jgi:hypothetical protein
MEINRDCAAHVMSDGMGWGRLAWQSIQLGILVLVSGCALPVHTRTVANRFDSPEASGRLGKGHAEGGFDGGQDFFISSDATQTPPDLSHPAFGRSDFDAVTSAGVGLLDRLDVDLKLHLNSDLIFQAKYQLLGDTELNAKAGNFSMAFTAGVGGHSDKDSTADVDFSTSGSSSHITSSYDMSSTDYEFAAILGYRLNESVLIYTSPYFARRLYSGTIYQTSSSYAFSGTLNHWGECLGVGLAASHFQMKVEYAADYASSMGIKRFGGFVGAIFGFRWGPLSEEKSEPKP